MMRPSEDSDALTLTKGFIKIRASRFETEGGTRVRIERQERMHKFRTGYQDTGPAVPIFTGTEEDAKQVYEVLKEWFEDE